MSSSDASPQRPTASRDRFRSVRWLAQTVWQDAAGFVVPPSCLLCSRPLAEAERHACVGCLRRIWQDQSPASCAGCGMPIAVTTGAANAAAVGDSESTASSCPECRSQHFAFGRTFTLGLYKNHLRRAILRAKQSRGRDLLEPLARMVYHRNAAEIAAESFDLVTAIPTHWSRAARRPVLPAMRLGKVIADLTNLPFHRLLTATRRTEKQGTLTPQERRQNMKGAFVVNAGYVSTVRKHVTGGARVLLVDDVLTTGATCDAAARALREADAGRVAVLVIARGFG